MIAVRGEGFFSILVKLTSQSLKQNPTIFEGIIILFGMHCTVNLIQQIRTLAHAFVSNKNLVILVYLCHSTARDIETHQVNL